MPRFSKRSTVKLLSCDEQLIVLFNEVIKTYDCSILCGHRGEQAQNEAFKNNRSSLAWPESKHNLYPSIAVDVAPYPINWNDSGRFYMFAGYVKRIAEELNISIRYGGDWNSDTFTTDQQFNDLVHFELR